MHVTKLQMLPSSNYSAKSCVEHVQYIGRNMGICSKWTRCTFLHCTSVVAEKGNKAEERCQGCAANGSSSVGETSSASDSDALCVQEEQSVHNKLLVNSVPLAPGNRSVAIVEEQQDTTIIFQGRIQPLTRIPCADARTTATQGPILRSPPNVA